MQIISVLLQGNCLLIETDEGPINPEKITPELLGGSDPIIAEFLHTVLQKIEENQKTITD